MVKMSDGEDEGVELWASASQATQLLHRSGEVVGVGVAVHQVDVLAVSRALGEAGEQVGAPLEDPSVIWLGEDPGEESLQVELTGQLVEAALALAGACLDRLFEGGLEPCGFGVAA